MTDISFIFPYIHEYPAIIHSIYSAQNEMSDENYSYEIICVENGVIDNTTFGRTMNPDEWQEIYEKRAYIDKEQFPNWSFLKFFRVPINKGILKYSFEEVQCGPAARMKGVREARGKRIIFADAHTEFGKNTVPLLYDSMDELGCGEIHGTTVKTHWVPNGGGHYRLFGNRGPNLYSHFHGSYCWTVGDEPYKIVGGQLAYVMFDREEFLSLRGYHPECRFYPHPEGYLPLKYLMFDREVYIHPKAFHFHSGYKRDYRSPALSAGLEIEISGDSYRLRGNDNLIRNAMICGYTLGGDEWLNHIYDYWATKIRSKYVLNGIKENAKQSAEEERQWILDHATYTLNEVLTEARRNEIIGMENWFKPLGRDPVGKPKKKTVKRKQRKKKEEPKEKPKPKTILPPKSDTKLGEEIELDTTFSNDAIEVAPPQRKLFYVEWAGEVNDEPFRVDMKKWKLSDMKNILRGRRLDFPEVLGNWEEMNIWIKNMWEALYNPPTLIKMTGRRPIGIWHGHHRLRLLDAMEADYIWCYEMTAKRGRRQLPQEIGELMKKNDREPEKGTVMGTCEHCGANTRWRRVTHDRISDIKMYCMKCGEENPYPYPGRL